jgi:WD40 repeat protein
MNLSPLHKIKSHNAAVYSLCVGENSQIVYSASGDGYLAAWNIISGSQEKFAVNVGQPVFSVIYLKPYGLLVAGTQDGSMHVIDRSARKELKHIDSHTNGIYGFATNTTQDLLFVAGGDGVLTIWNLPDFALLRSIPLCTEKIRQISFGSNNVAIACGDGTIRILELTFFNEIKTLEVHEVGATMVAHHPSKPVLLSGGKDALLKVHDIRNDWKLLLTIPAHNFAIYDLQFDQEGNTAFTASRDKSIKVWDSKTLHPLQKLDIMCGGHSHSVNSIVYTSDRLISAGDDRQIIVWNRQP